VAEIRRAEAADSPYQPLLETALNCTGDGNRRYVGADPYVKRLLNDQLLERVEIKGGELVSVELKPPFHGLFIGRGHQPANIGEAGKRSLAGALGQLAESLESASDAALEWPDSKDSEDDDGVAKARERLLTALDESHDLAATMTRLARSLEAVAPPTQQTARTASRQSS
jgi:hypothetical protein